MHKRLDSWLRIKNSISIVVAIFAALGTILLFHSHAATPSISAEAEAGTITSPASLLSDTTASASKAVKFGPATTSIPTPTSPPADAMAPIGVTGAWKIAFDDEFNDTSLDTSKWEPTWFGEGSTMNNVGTYASNVSVSGGEARLQLSTSSKGALIHTGYQAGHYQLPVGSFVEARIYFPGSGTTMYNWPAWWANSTNNYPASGENDIAEGLETLTVNYHSPSGAHNMGTITGTWSNAYHTYGLYRQTGKASVYWDGTLVKSYTTDDDGRAEDLILNVGSGQGPTVLGSAGAMRVDYVRAWHL